MISSAKTSKLVTLLILFTAFDCVHAQMSSGQGLQLAITSIVLNTKFQIQKTVGILFESLGLQENGTSQLSVQ